MDNTISFLSSVFCLLCLHTIKYKHHPYFPALLLGPREVLRIDSALMDKFLRSGEEGVDGVEREWFHEKDYNG
ncbi:hypothetical protein VNO80_17372 [Phaseolus coccineus]|uniref:Uncharacterized protein n=1 Tax=Phaseolus coccineus TaxID=3886 RepID=A0AAN9MTU0_PHACN